MAPSVANSDHLGEDVGTAPPEKNDNNSEKGDGRDTSDEEKSTLSLGSTASFNNTTNQIGKMIPRVKFKGKEKSKWKNNKREIKNKKKNKNKKEIKKDSYLLQRTRVPILHPESMPNTSTTMFLL